MSSPFREFIGVKSHPVRNEVEKGAIRKFADSIGDANPQYRDSEGQRMVAPPTFSRTFDYGMIPGLTLPTAGLIHGEQGFEYFHPIYAGDLVFCSSTLVDVRERAGKLGAMVYLTYENDVEDENGVVLLKERITVILRQRNEVSE